MDIGRDLSANFFSTPREIIENGGCTFLGPGVTGRESGRKWSQVATGRWRASGGVPRALWAPLTPPVTPAKAGARIAALTFCRRAAKRSPSQDCAQAVHATEALVVSRGRATYALSKVLNSCHMAHAGVAPPGTVLWPGARLAGKQAVLTGVHREP